MVIPRNTKILIQSRKFLHFHPAFRNCLTSGKSKKMKMWNRIFCQTNGCFFLSRYFNTVQSESFNETLLSDSNMVVAAPTGR